MKYSKTIAIVLLQCLVLVFGAVEAVCAADELRTSEAAKPSAKDLVLKGDAKCTRCHDETDDIRILAIGKTRHGTIADPRAPTCTSCHGESVAHVDNPTGAQERPKPDRGFGGRSITPIGERNQACLACHQGGKRIHWAIGAHANGDVACTSCHQVHTAHDPAQDKRAQAQVCFGCHTAQRVQVSRPSRHPILEGKVACSDCHNPHGGAGERALVRDSVNDTCYECHMEKRGPFVRGHQPVSEDCTICHNPHGSINYSLLKLRSPFLCQQCHEPTGHRGSFPSLTGTSTGANTLARGCLNCHTNIHGTNNPANISNERTFRR